MLGEGVGTVVVGVTWPTLSKVSSGAYSVHVSEADYEIRLSRALELVMPGRPSLCPRQEGSLSWWLSGNAITMAGLSYGAYLSFGLDWAMVNGLTCLNSDLMTSVKRLLPLCTNERVQNCGEAKRLYLDGCEWSYAKLTRNLSSDGMARSLKKTGGFPAPMFLIKAIMSNMGVGAAQTGVVYLVQFIDIRSDIGGTAVGSDISEPVVTRRTLEQQVIKALNALGVDLEKKMSTCRVLLNGVEVDVYEAVDVNGQPVLNNGDQARQPKKPRRDRVRAQIDGFLGHLKSAEESREKWRRECQSMEEERLVTEERQHQELLSVVRQLTTAVTRLLPQEASTEGEHT
ncbi:hypothetical protein MTO96_032249 [Rhipicephalus appendiculatus]